MARKPGPRRLSIFVDLPSDLFLPLVAEAARRRVSRAAVVRWALEAYFQQREAPPERDGRGMERVS